MVPARVGLVLTTLSLAACFGGSRSAGLGNGPDRSSVSRIIIDVAELETPPNLVTLIQSRVSNVQVRRDGSCPDLEFRGRKSLVMRTPPGVYVNGQHALNTCILDMLNPHDIDLVEVYPSGVSNRPGYFSTAGGLILVFLKDGPEMDEGGSR
jgi:hypothetical protein